MNDPSSRFTAITLAAILATALSSRPVRAGGDPPDPLGADFWTTWGDGRAEVATYDLTYPRYGEPRHGTAVTIFVTETFSRSRRVKVDPTSDRPEPDLVPVLKLNLVVDFPTGIYDYNLMTSTFVALAATERPLGTPLKVSFSSQEWCGHVYQQIEPEANELLMRQHSYFDGEAERDAKLPYPADAMLEDVVFHWARGLATPFMARGEDRKVQLLTASDTVRLTHHDPEWRQATLHRFAESETIDAPAGKFEVERRTIDVPGQRSWSLWVETGSPHRIVAWSTSDGQRGELVRSERLKYWQMHANDDAGTVKRIGLTPRPARTM